MWQVFLLIAKGLRAIQTDSQGIVSGGGSYKPAIVLDKRTDNTGNKRIPIALMGKVYCKVDATHSPVEIGDLLTTSSVKGHAMKAEDPYKAMSMADIRRNLYHQGLKYVKMSDSLWLNRSSPLQEFQL